MARLLPQWRLTFWRLNSASCGVPQDRSRVFFLGASPFMLCTLDQHRLLDEPPRPLRVCSINDYTDQ
eukprot:12918983-Prorocentrum_lima.AAC.1